MEIFVKWKSGEFAFEVEFVFGAVGGMVKDGVGVMEDIFFGNFGIFVVGLELS